MESLNNMAINRKKIERQNVTEIPSIPVIKGR